MWRLSRPAVLFLRLHAHRQCSKTAEEAEEDFLVQQLIQGCDVTAIKAPPSTSGPSHNSITSSASVAAASSASIPVATRFSIQDFPDPCQPTSSSPAATQAPPKHEEASHLYRCISVRRTTQNRVEWQCVKCAVFNDEKQRSCAQCGLSRISSMSPAAVGPPARHVALVPTEWYCNSGSCRHLNRQAPDTSSNPRKRYLCSSCGEPFKGLHDWLCQTCHVRNPKAATQCGSCFRTRPLQWTCSHCGEERNSIFSVGCATCGKVKKGRDVYSVDGPSPEAFAVCRQCKTLNLAKWEVCSNCVAPLPVMFKFSSKTPIDVVSEDLEPKSRSVFLPATMASIDTTVSVVRTSPPSTASSDVNKRGETVSAISEARSSAPMPLSNSNAEEEPRAHHTDAYWVCQTQGCGAVHRLRVPLCDSCLQPRTNVVKPLKDLMQTYEVPKPSSGVWSCDSCHEKNSPTLTVCSACSSPRVVPQGYWQCGSCLSVNRNARILCIGCHRSQPIVSTRISIARLNENGTWVCHSCGFHKNFQSSVACDNCGCERAGWICRTCETRNKLSAPKCSSCGQSRHESLTKCMVCSAKCRPGATHCDGCGAEIANSALRWTCAKCGFEENDLLKSSKCLRCSGTSAHDGIHRLWVCHVCHTSQVKRPVGNKGSMLYNRCLKCFTPYSSALAVELPIAWSCSNCQAQNRISVENCVTCGGSRSADWNTTVTCPHCVRQTSVDRDERCHHCKHSLRLMLSNFFGQLRIENDAEAELIRHKNSPKAIPLQTSVIPTTDDDELDDPDDSEDGDGEGDLSGSEAASPFPSLSTPASATWLCSLCNGENLPAAATCTKCGIPKEM